MVVAVRLATAVMLGGRVVVMVRGRLLMVIGQDVDDDPPRRSLFGKLHLRQEILPVEEGFDLLVEKVHVHRVYLERRW